MPLLANTGLVSLGAATARSCDQEITTRDQLIGTWLVKMLKATTGNQISYPLGREPSGYVTITNERMWVLFVDSARKAPATAALTRAEAVAMMKSQVAWTGRYTTAEHTADGIKVAAHVDTASNQAIVGNDRVYFMRVAGNKLTVKSPGVTIPMTGATGVVEFELVKAD